MKKKRRYPPGLITDPDRILASIAKEGAIHEECCDRLKPRDVLETDFGPISLGPKTVRARKAIDRAVERYVLLLLADDWGRPEG